MYLRDVVQRIVERYLERCKKNLSFPIARSTYVLAVADPLRVLQPGEIHISFSKSFLDEKTGTSFHHLHGIEALLARHPALRRSDIQKVSEPSHARAGKADDRSGSGCIRT